MRTIEHWIGGRPATGTSTRTSRVFNPATGAQQAEVLLGSAVDVDNAVRSAADAFKAWSQSSLSQRTKVLFAFRQLVVDHATELAEIISDEHARSSPTRSARFSAGWRSWSSPAASPAC
jgi:malonate-semialdehyde dehydrogenase (acetylating)/methylmalonate-semialdehyde dehydrogenase